MKTLQKLKLGDSSTLKYGKMPTKTKVGIGDYEIFTGYRYFGKYPEKNCNKGDVIVVARGVGGTGDVKIARSDCYLTNLSILISLDKKKINNKYFYYKYYLETLRYLDTGSAQSQITINDLENLEVEVPDLLTQQQIADVLSAYDDLIENNNRRIKILEETAQKIYTEWFVNFRFPGHEKVKMADSGTEFGMIPEGWEVKRLIDIAHITMGQSPTSDSYNSEGRGTVFHQGVTNFGTRFPDDILYSIAGNKIANAGDILFSVRAPVGRINIANQKTILGRGVSGINSKSNTNSFLLYLLKKEFEVEDKIGSGSIFQSVTKTDLEGYQVLEPTADLIKGFENLTNDIDLLIKNLSISTNGLKKSRDLLIPQLVSGKLEIK